jgi:MFS family permease
MFGRVSDRISDKRLLPSIGIAIAAVGELTVVFYTEQYSLPLVALTMVLVGFGMSMFSAPNTSVIMSSVPPAETGDASAMVSVMRQTGMMVSMGVAMLMISLIMGSADNLTPSTYGAFIDVLQYSFVIAFLMCCVGAVFSLMRGKGQRA